MKMLSNETCLSISGGIQFECNYAYAKFQLELVEEGYYRNTDKSLTYLSRLIQSGAELAIYCENPSEYSEAIREFMKSENAKKYNKEL